MGSSDDFLCEQNQKGSLRVKKILVFLLILLFSNGVFAKEIEYKLVIENPHQNYFKIEIAYEIGEKQFVDFIMPAWTPGSYVIKDWAKNVIQVLAKNSKQENLEVSKIDKQTWRVISNNSDKIVLSYKVYAYTRGKPYHAHIEKDFAFYNGALLFMYVRGQKEKPCNIQYLYPDDWDVHTSLQIKLNENHYQAANYDEFIDCPAFLGKLAKFSFEVAGIPHYVVMNAGYEYNEEQITNDLSKLINWFYGLFGEIPYNHYTFFLRISDPGSGGIEHLYSNISSITPASLSGDIDDYAYYNKLLMLESHEYFHLFNVKRIRPTGLGPFDYTKEVYTKMLWVSEGFTSYYTHRPLVKAGVIIEEKAFKSWSKYYNGLINNTALHLKPVAQYSYDAWLRSDIPDYSFRVYYSKGALIAMMLDFDMRFKTNHQKSIDGFFSYLYHNIYKKNITFDINTFLDYLNDYSEIDYTEFFGKYVLGIEKIPFEEYLNKAGIELEIETELPYLGIKLDTKIKDTPVVFYVYPNSPADKLEIGRGDIITELAGEMVAKENWNDLISNLEIGEEMEIKWNHNDQLQSGNIKTAKKRITAYKIQRKSNITEKQTEFMEKWLGVESK